MWGTGFPVIELAMRGYPIIYNDRSQAMFQRAFMNAKLRNATLYPFFMATFAPLGNAMWNDFSPLPDEEFQAVLCKGNSLPYVISWGKTNQNIRKARREIRRALRQFYRLLKPNGLLYVDKQPENQLCITAEDLGEVIFQDRKVQMYWTIKNDRINKTRKWNIQVRDIETYRIQNYDLLAYLIQEKELLEDLRSTGFRNVEKQKLRGDIYEGFIALK